MATISFDFNDYSDNRTIGVTGEDRVELPHPCNSITIFFRNSTGDFSLELNAEQEKGIGTHLPVNIPPDMVATINGFPVHSITVRGAAGSDWSYIALLKPGSGMGFSEVT